MATLEKIDLVDALEEPGFASEMTRDGYCPTCKATEEVRASVHRPTHALHTCPICSAETRLYRDANGTLTTSGECAHFLRVVNLGGTIDNLGKVVGGQDVIEFAP